MQTKFFSLVALMAALGTVPMVACDGGGDDETDTQDTDTQDTDGGDTDTDTDAA